MTGPGTKSDDKETKSRPPGLDVALECAAGEYAKGLLHKVELTLGLETDTSEIVNECIKSVRPFGTVSITGVYAGYVCLRALPNRFTDATSPQATPTISTSEL